jgi:hypothetical protein
MLCISCGKTKRWVTGFAPGINGYHCQTCRSFRIDGDSVVITGGDDLRGLVFSRWCELRRNQQFRNAVMCSDTRESHEYWPDAEGVYNNGIDTERY